MIGQDKLYLLETRLAPILRREQLRDLEALAERLRAPGDEALAREVVEAMTTNESLFFRDDKPFEHFRTPGAAAAMSRAPGGAALRVWSAASSSGQEAYSLAMILAEMPRQRSATAGSRSSAPTSRASSCARAREGLYTQFEVQRGLPVQMLMKLFPQGGSGLADQRGARAAWCSFANGICWPTCGRSGGSMSCSAATC